MEGVRIYYYIIVVLIFIISIICLICMCKFGKTYRYKNDELFDAYYDKDRKINYLVGGIYLFVCFL